jgi:hypothetical protein
MPDRPAAAATSSAARPPASVPVAGAVAKGLCLTFDDGPWAFTTELVNGLNKLSVPAVFYVNCHKGDQDAVAAAKLIVSSGHILGNHMCKHDIMARADYQKNYYPWEAGKCKARAGVATDCTWKDTRCLEANNAAGTQTFNEYFKGTPSYWQSQLGGNVGNLFMKFLRLNGDGRFFSCLKEKAAEIQPGVKHMGWNYEITSPGTFKGREKAHNPNGEFVPTGTDGVLGAPNPTPNTNDVVLAHDLHWNNGRLTNLLNWVTSMKNKGFTFVLPDSEGRCNGAPLRYT